MRQALQEVLPDNFSMEASRDSPPQAKKEDGPPDAVYQQGKVRGVYRYGVHSVCDGNTTECGSMCEELPWPPEDCLRQVRAATYPPRRAHRRSGGAPCRRRAGWQGSRQLLDGALPPEPAWLGCGSCSPRVAQWRIHHIGGAEPPELAWRDCDSRSRLLLRRSS